MQLDIFPDSRDVMLRNEVLHALERCDAAAAGSARQALRDEFPHDDARAALAVLAGALQQQDSAAFESHDALREPRQRLRAGVVPAAQRLFGTGAAAWLAPRWRDAARRAARLLVMLLGLERQGRHHELIERRKSLRDLRPGLWRAYMTTR